MVDRRVSIGNRTQIITVSGGNEMHRLRVGCLQGQGIEQLFLSPIRCRGSPGIHKTLAGKADHIAITSCQQQSVRALCITEHMTPFRMTNNAHFNPGQGKITTVCNAARNTADLLLIIREGLHAGLYRRTGFNQEPISIIVIRKR